MRERESRGVGDCVWPVLLGLLACSACGSPAMIQDVTRSGDRWTIAIDEVTDGPDQFRTRVGHMARVVTANHDARFIHVWLEIRNDAGEKRSFYFSNCTLNTGDERLAPVFVTDGELEVVRFVEAESGESFDRRLIYIFPGRNNPRSLQCGPIEFPLPDAQIRGDTPASWVR